jgi:hypothetical protein
MGDARNTSVSGTPVFQEHQCFRNTSVSGTPVFQEHQCFRNTSVSGTMGNNREVSMYEKKYVCTSR